MKLRVALPLSQILLANPDKKVQLDGVTLAGGSLEAEFRRLWAVEMGMTAMSTPIQGQGYDLFARGGLVPILYDAKDADGRGGTIQLDALAGYRFLKRFKSPDGHDGSELTHAVRGNLGLDFTWQFSNIGIGTRLLTGVTVPVSQTRTDYWARHDYFLESDDLRWALDVGLDFSIVL